MNKHTSPKTSDISAKVPANHVALRAWLIIGGVALLMMALLLAAPVLAANQPHGAVEQGTVPPPVPMPTDDDDNERPTATPTAVPAGGAVESAPATDVPATDAPASDVVVPANYAGVVTSERLNVRQGPGVGFAVLGQLRRDESVIIQYRDQSSNWWYTCCISGTTTSGWVSAQFVQPEFVRADAATLLPPYPDLDALPTPPVPVATRTVQTGALTAVVDAQPRLNLRQDASASSPVVGKIQDGQQVEAISRNGLGDWWYICCIADGLAERLPVG